MTNPQRVIGIKIAKFVGLAVVDLLVPDAISKPFGLLKSFYYTFLVTAPRDRLALYAEAAMTTEKERNQVIACLVQEIGSLLPPDERSRVPLQSFCEHLVDCLRAAQVADEQGRDADEALRQKLNQNYFKGQDSIVSLKLAPAERQIGRLRVSTVLQLLPASHTSTPELNLRILPTLGDYEFLQTIGQGGFAVVYKALHRPSGELRAIKIGLLTEPERLQRELRIMEKMNSPHLVKYHEHGEFTENGEQQYWLAMEYLGEQTLADLMNNPEFRNRPDDLLLIAEQILQGTNDLHAAGIIHRDIKPSNIMFDRHNRVKLIDLGLAKPLETQDMLSTGSIGAAMGTPYYMSPEQLQGEKLTPASDLYSWALVTYELLSGVNPNAASTIGKVILNANNPNRTWEHPGLPVEMKPTLVRCFTLDPAQRPQSTTDYLIDWHRAAQEATTHINFERDRESWLKILDGNLLPKYLQSCADSNTEPTATEFNNYLQDQQLAPVSENRLGEVLPQLWHAQKQSEIAKQNVIEIQRSLLNEPSSLSSEQLIETGKKLKSAEDTVTDRQAHILKTLSLALQNETLNYESYKSKIAIEKQRSIESEQKAQSARENKQALKAITFLGLFVIVAFIGWAIYYSNYVLARVFKGHTDSVLCVAFNPDGQTILTGSSDHTAKLWDASKGQEIHTLTGHSDAVRSVTFSPDGQTILTGSWDKTAKLWNASNGQEIRTLTGHSSFVSSIAYSPDGQTILTGSGDKTAKLWNASTGQEIHTLTGHSGSVSSVAFSPDGQTILTGSGDKTAKLWYASNGREIRTLTGHSKAVFCVAFSPDGKTILTGSEDQTAKLWDAATGNSIRTLDESSGSVQCVAFSPDGKTILTGSWKTVRLWDTSNGQEIRTLTKSMETHSNWVYSVAFSPDGQNILTGSHDKTTKLWWAK